MSQEQTQQPRRKFSEGLLDNELIVEALEIKAGQTIVDAGCGNGYMSKIFARAVTASGEVYALDPGKHFINQLQTETEGSNIEALEADITKPTQLAASSVDLIYIATVMHIFSQEQIRGFVQEANRLLKPNALLAIVEIEKKDTPFGPPLRSRLSPEELKSIVPMLPVKTLQVGDYFYMQVFKNAE